MLSRTEPLRRELAAALPSRPFTVEFWDGTSVPATQDEAPTFTIRSPDALAHVLRAPGELGLGRAYALGLIDVDDIGRALRIVDTFEAPSLRPGQIARLAGALVAGAGVPTKLPRPPKTELRLRGPRHTIARDRRAVRHHYDAGNDFFALFLDESMTYSCAVWRGATTLEEAQEAKRELVCTKLRLSEGERVLDVGCGWGSMALHAASRYGVRVLGITLSEPQVALARERAAAAGVGDLVEFRVADYRELVAEPFDAIWSIGMVEHVGAEQIDAYMRTLTGLLGPGGRLLNHGIAKLEDLDTPDEGAFSERFVFPDGVPLPLSRVIAAMELAGLTTTHVEGLQPDYAETITHWIERYERRYDEAVRIAGEERARVWRLYLHAARQGFQTGWASVYQVLAHKP